MSKANNNAIWQKVLGPDEEIKHEFSVGEKYVKVALILWAVLSFFLLFLLGLGILVFGVVLFYYLFYIPRARLYAFTNKRIIAHKGWLNTVTVSVPYDKITDVRVKESFLERAFTSTGNLDVNTAGTGMHEVVLEHIESPHETKKKLDEFIK